MSDFGQPPHPGDLQFQQAELLPQEGVAVGPQCVVCKKATGNTYFHAQGHVVCPVCAERIQTGQQKPPAISLAKAALYGSGAAIAGLALCSAVSILLHGQIGWIAFIVGYMVGKAIRYGSDGLGGRPQQILAVLLTYFAISASIVPVIVWEFMSRRPELATRHIVLSWRFLEMLLLSGLASPFYRLSSFSGLIYLFIIFIGLQRAWALTARSEILVMGPYEAAPAS